MTEAQIKLGCLELAATMLKPHGIYDVTTVVETATVLYTFTQAPAVEETPPSPVDKPKRKKSAINHPDILS